MPNFHQTTQPYRSHTISDEKKKKKKSSTSRKSEIFTPSISVIYKSYFSTLICFHSNHDSTPFRPSPSAFIPLFPHRRIFAPEMQYIAFPGKNYNPFVKLHYAKFLYYGLRPARERNYTEHTSYIN